MPCCPFPPSQLKKRPSAKHFAVEHHRATHCGRHYFPTSSTQQPPQPQQLPPAHRSFRSYCQRQHQLTLSPQGHAPPSPSSQEAGCKRPRQIRTPQRCPSPSPGQVPYAARWWPFAWRDGRATIAATRKTSGWFGRGETRVAADDVQEVPRSTRNSQTGGERWKGYAGRDGEPARWGVQRLH